MIAVSEPPLEFIPRGRRAVAEHPGPTEAKLHTHLASENILLQRLQNVNISAKEEHNEFWCIREVYEDCEWEKKVTKCLKTNTTNEDNQNNKSNFSYPPREYISENLLNSEEELYVKKHTAVWTRGN